MAKSVLGSGLPLVIKAGGSLAETGRLRTALDIISLAARPVIVVPGGGALADKVRDLQKFMRFDDEAAHRLAMLAMHQMAELFAGMTPRIVVTDSFDGIRAVLSGGKIPVWVPLPMLDQDKTIPADWSITSDGIAARLAELLGGAPLVLLKPVSVDARKSATELALEGIVDAAFPAIVRRAGLKWRICGPDDDAALAQMLAAVGAPV